MVTTRSRCSCAKCARRSALHTSAKRYSPKQIDKFFDSGKDLFASPARSVTTHVYPVRQNRDKSFYVDFGQNLLASGGFADITRVLRGSVPNTVGIWVVGGRERNAQWVAQQAGFTKTKRHAGHPVGSGGIAVGKPHLHPIERTSTGERELASHIFWGDPAPASDFADFDTFDDLWSDAFAEQPLFATAMRPVSPLGLRQKRRTKDQRRNFVRPERRLSDQYFDADDDYLMLEDWLDTNELDTFTTVYKKPITSLYWTLTSGTFTIPKTSDVKIWLKLKHRWPESCKADSSKVKVTLVREIDWWPDKSYKTCVYTAVAPSKAGWQSCVWKVPKGTYYIELEAPGKCTITGELEVTIS